MKKINMTPPLKADGCAWGYAVLWHHLRDGLERRGVKLVFDGSEVCDTILCVGSPHQVFRWHPKQRVVMYTMFEPSLLPPFMIQGAYAVDALIVPANHQVRMLRESGILGDIYVAPMGLDPVFASPQYSRTRDEKKFWLFNSGALSLRKGQLDLIAAMNELRDELPGLRLLLKVTHDFRARFKLGKIYDPDIFLVKGRLAVNKLIQLYHKADLYISPSRGEGDIGLPTLEAMGCGTPVAATGWLFRDSDYPHLYLSIDYTLCPADYFRDYWGPCGDWAAPSIDDICDAIRYAYHHRAEIREMGLAMSRWVHEHRTWDACVDVVYDVLFR